MNSRRVSFIVLVVVAIFAMVGGVSAQGSQSTSDPTPPWHHNDPHWQGSGQHNFQLDHYNGNNNNSNRRDHFDRRGRRNGQQFFAPAAPVTQVVIPPITVIAQPSQEAILNHIEQIVADTLALPLSEVTSEMTTMTLAQIITAHAGNLPAVQADIITGITAWVNQTVADGLIAQQNANVIFGELTAIVQRALNGQFTQTGTTVVGLEV